MEKLVTSFNPASVDGLMCGTLISVSWTGRLYDCDFNQMLDLPVDGALPQTIHEFDLALLARRQVVTGLHCYGCTAGAGSSRGGAISWLNDEDCGQRAHGGVLWHGVDCLFCY